MATGVDDSGLESRQDYEILLVVKTSRPALGSIQPPVQWLPGSFPGIKRPERGVDHPPPSSAEVRNE
jgi:hypothetical protein